MPPASPRIFLSYSRVDRDFAIMLRDEMRNAGLSVWHDLTDLEAGQWWSQIADVLEGKAIEHIVLIASPDAQASKIVAQECWFAQREGKTASLVVPSKHAGKIDFGKLPRFMQAAHHYYENVPAQKAKLFERLGEPGQGPRRPRPEGRQTPADYIARDSEFGRMRAALIDSAGEATTATVVLTGFGGFGKTTLASAFVDDEAVQQAYFNGILLVELGEGLVLLPKTYDGRKVLEGQIKTKIETLIKTLERRDERFDDLNAAKTRLKEILDKRHGAVMLWIDDAWAEDHVRHFIEAAPNAAKLVTTRIRDMFPNATARVDVDELTDAQATAFMGRSLKPTSDVERTGLSDLATTTAGRWPILIRQINAQLRYLTTAQIGRAVQPLGNAITSLRARLKHEGLDDLDKSTDTNRATAVRLSVSVGFDILREEDRHRKYAEGFHEARYLDLAGFQQAEIPIATIARLWDHLAVLRSSSVSPPETLDDLVPGSEDRRRAMLREESIAILERMYALALLQKLDTASPDGMVRLHDVMRQYLADKQKSSLKAFHQQFVLAYDAESGETVSDLTARERRYFYTWFPTHLLMAGEQEALDALLLDPRWMHRQVQESGIQALLADFEKLAPDIDSARGLIRQALRLAATAIGRDKRQLLPQLHGRLMGREANGLPNFVARAAQAAPRPSILTWQPSLTAPGGPEIATLTGHTNVIRALAQLSDGTLVSGSADNTVRTWDLRTGAETARHSNFSAGIYAFATLPNDKLAVGLMDGTILIMDPVNGIEFGRCVGHTDSVWVLRTLADGRLASGSNDRTIRIWDLTRCTEAGRLTGHTGGIISLAVLGNGWLTSGSEDKTIRIWNPTHAVQIAQQNLANGWASALAALPGGGFVAGTQFGEAFMWDSTLTEIARLAGDWHPIWAIEIESSDRIALGSASNAIRLWNPKASTEAVPLTGHSRAIWSLSALANGMLVSGSADMTIRVWDPQKAIETRKRVGHLGAIKALAVLPHGMLASGSSDSTIKLWNHTGGHEVTTLDGRSGQVSSLIVLPDGRLAAGFGNSIQILDPSQPDKIIRLSGGSARVNALAALPNGRLASGSKDGTIRIWDTTTCLELAFLNGHTASVEALVTLPDGRLASGSTDGKIRLWNVDNRSETLTITGHDSSINCLISADKHIVSGCADGSIRSWNIQSGTQTVHLKANSDWIWALALHSENHLLSGSHDGTVQLWDIESQASVCRLKIDAAVHCLAVLPDRRVVAGDDLGRLHWLEIVH